MKPGDIGIARRESANAPVWEAKIRVLLNLDGTTFYDTFQSETGRWDLARRRTYAYTRSETQWLEQHTKWIGHEPLTEKEKQTHREDWPMFALRSIDFPWDLPEARHLEDFHSFGELASCHINYANLEGLESNKLAICGPNSGIGIRKTLSAEARNSANFSAAELLWHACRYFASHHPAVNPNTAYLHRLGLNNHRPWYIIFDQNGP